MCQATKLVLKTTRKICRNSRTMRKAVMRYEVHCLFLVRVYRPANACRDDCWSQGYHLRMMGETPAGKNPHRLLQPLVLLQQVVDALITASFPVMCRQLQSEVLPDHTAFMCWSRAHLSWRAPSARASELSLATELAPPLLMLPREELSPDSLMASLGA
jgi:hypothetical protein